MRWLVVTALMGMAFLSNQALEYVQVPFSISSHAYGSIFFVMTGFHGLHVIGGLLFMAAVVAMISGRTSRAPVRPTMQVCAYYWHFVDVVWVAMFLTIYVLKMTAPSRTTVAADRCRGLRCDGGSRAGRRTTRRGADRRRLGSRRATDTSSTRPAA